ncbi:MAG: tetratricopeptide repeat protein [Phycisphaerales bacterium]|nr:tetratricopeptide repeat protein [Phycisphaerales bacterium]MCB9862352.1 tetratricopeptide repeat protein [Phycisphaerales bacterium]
MSRRTRIMQSVCIGAVRSTVVALLLATALPCQADEPAPQSDSPRARIEMALSRFDQAVALRNHDSPAAQRLYAESLDLFNSVINDGIENGHLQYNAGNAALRLGRIGEAIAHYKLAEALIPGDRDLLRNLAFARRLCSLQIASNPKNAVLDTLMFWHRDSSTRSRWIAMSIGYVAFWTLLLIRLRIGKRSAPLFWTTAFAALVAITVGATVVYDAFEYGKGTQGVVVRNDTVLRKGNGEGYQPQLENPLPDGVEFSIIEARDSANGDRWLRIELPDGTDGWINAERAIVI